MERYVIIMNLLSAIVLLLAIIIVIVRFFKTRIQYKILIGLALFFLSTESLINVLEHSGILNNTEEFEQIVSILVLPILAFGIYESIIKDELHKRIISEQKFIGIFNQTFSFIGLLDTDGLVIEANSTACKFAGYIDNEFVGIPFRESPWWTRTDKNIEIWDDAVKQAKMGKIVRFETVYFDIHEEKHYIDFSLKPVIDEHDNVVFLLPEGRDITDITLAKMELEEHKKNLELKVYHRTQELENVNEELRSINDELNHKSEIINSQNNELKETLNHLKEAQSNLLQSEKMASLGTLTAGVAHEINNPLNYLMGAYVGLNDYFNKYDSNDTAKTELYLTAIKEGIKRVSDIVNGLNQFSRNNNNYDEECSIHSILDNCLIMLSNQLRNRIEVQKQYYNKQIIIKGNVAEFHQAFINILTNSIQAIENKGLISITTKQNNNNVLIIIEDNGHGIEKKIINQISDPFFTTKSPGQGTGLGLSIVYSIIKEHKGNINFESIMKQGTKVTINLPLKL